jgi:hypothetical protein
MKKILILFAFVCACGILSAQTVPNADFEQWNSDEEAAGWTSSFSMDLMMTSFDYSSAEKSSNSHTGYFAMGLHPYAIDLMLTSYTLPGIAHLGTFNADFDITNLLGGFGGGGGLDAGSFIESMVQGGITCNRVPQSVKAWIRYVPADGDAMSVTVRCYSNGEVVAEGTYNSTTASYGYEQITIPVTATSSATPDQLNIIFNCGSAEGSNLYIDDIELVMEGGSGIEEPANVIFSAGPNPTRDIITVTPTVAGSYSAVLFDMNGREVWAGQSLQGATKVDVSELSEGVYFLKVTANGLTRTEKIMVK